MFTPPFALEFFLLSLTEVLEVMRECGISTNWLGSCPSWLIKALTRGLNDTVRNVLKEALMGMLTEL